MRCFVLLRQDDQTGVSGTGVVAEGTEFSDKTVVIRWQSPTPSTVVWNSVEDAIKVHGHGGKTLIVFRECGGACHCSVNGS